MARDSVNLGALWPGCFGFAQVLDRHERFWRHGRVYYWLSRPGPARTVCVGSEWSVFDRTLRRLRLKVSTTGEETLDVAVGLGPLGQWYNKLDVSRANGRLVRLPGVRFDVELGATGVGWCLGSDDGGWARHERLVDKLRRNHLTWWRVHRYRRSNEEVETRLETLAMPEGPHPVSVTLERSVWGMRVGPYRATRTSRRRLAFWLPGFRRVEWSATVSSQRGLPIPGKGENSWDCGPDAIFSTSSSVRAPFDRADHEWVGQALAAATASVYRQRTRHGAGVADTGI